MPTTSLTHSQTRSITIGATPQDVFSFVADPLNLPRWAPLFARAVRHDGAGWLITSGETEFPVTVRTSAEHGTVDLLAGPQLDTGAYSRVIPNGTGSEYLFTLFFPDGTPEEAISGQMEVVEGELRTVRKLVEAG